MKTIHSRTHGAAGLKKVVLLTAGTFLLSFSAQAAGINLDFTVAGGTNSGSGFGNFRTFTSGGVTVTATAWSVTGDSNTTFQSSQLGKWTGYGLGVCNQNEGVNCSSPVHQVSGENGYDFVLFQFSPGVVPYTVAIKPYGTYDRDVTFFVGNTANNLDLTGIGLSGLGALGFSIAQNDDSTVSNQGRVVTLSSGNVNSLLFGVRAGGDSNTDYFKITELSLGSSVPEPATSGMLGLALVGLALSVKRRRS